MGDWFQEREQGKYDAQFGMPQKSSGLSTWYDQGHAQYSPQHTGLGQPQQMHTGGSANVGGYPSGGGAGSRSGGGGRIIIVALVVGAIYAALDEAGGPGDAVVGLIIGLLWLLGVAAAAVFSTWRYSTAKTKRGHMASFSARFLRYALVVPALAAGVGVGLFAAGVIGPMVMAGEPLSLGIVAGPAGLVSAGLVAFGTWCAVPRLKPALIGAASVVALIGSVAVTDPPPTLNEAYDLMEMMGLR